MADLEFLEGGGITASHYIFYSTIRSGKGCIKNDFKGSNFPTKAHPPLNKLH